MNTTTIRLWNSGYKKWTVQTERPGKDITEKVISYDKMKKILSKLEEVCVNFTRLPRGSDYIIVTFTSFERLS